MVTLHGEEVSLGDEVWDILYGWGVVKELGDGSTYSIGVVYLDSTRGFSWIGANLKEKRLYWQPIEFEIPKNPKPKEKAWQGLFFDSQRADFESFLATQMPAVPPKLLFERRKDGEYVSLVAHYSWKAWQAAIDQVLGEPVAEVEVRKNRILTDTLMQATTPIADGRHKLYAPKRHKGPFSD